MISRTPFTPIKNPRCIKDPVVIGLNTANHNLRKIDAYIVLGLKGKRKLKDEEERLNKNSNRRERESALERQKRANPINFLRDSIPKTGFLDAIRNFILYTALGKLVPFVLKNLPKILNATKMLIPVYTFLENFFGNVLNGVVNAIDFGYKINDKLRGILKEATDGKFEKKFDELQDTLKTFLNIAIVAGLAIGGAGAGNLLKSKTPGSKTAAPKTPHKPTGTPKPKGKFKLPQIPGAKFFGKFGKVFGRVPIIGGLIDFAISVMMGENVGRATARSVGSILGASLGALIPVPGVGIILGGILGDIVGGALYDTLSSLGKPKKMASGGQVGQKAHKVPRLIRAKKPQKPPKQMAQRTTPGKNVGGKEEIAKVFSDSDDPKVMSPLRLLTKNSSVMKRAGIFGRFLSSGVELMALGQKIERPTLLGLEKYLAYVIDTAIAEKADPKTKMSMVSTLAMAEGGAVPATRTISQSGDSTGTVVARDILKAFNTSLSNKSGEILQNIKKEIALFVPGSLTGPGQSIDGMSGYGTPEEQALLKAIRFAEGTTQSYGVIYGGKIIPELEQGLMTVKEVIEMANTGKLPAKFGGRNAGYGPGSAATGAYQFMPDTLSGLVKEGTLSHEALFTNQMQDMAALALVKRRGVTLEDLKREGLSASVSEKLAPEWAALPTKSGRSYYGQPNKDLTSLQNIYRSSLEQARTSSTIGSGRITLEKVVEIAARMGLQMTSHIRTGDPKSYHYTGQAMDFSNIAQYGPGSPEMLRFAQFMAANYGATLAELYYTPLGFGIRKGRKITLSEVGERVNKTHYDHVHVAINMNADYYRNTPKINPPSIAIPPTPRTRPSRETPVIFPSTAPLPLGQPDEVRGLFGDLLKNLERQPRRRSMLPNSISGASSTKINNLVSSLNDIEDTNVKTKILIQPILVS
jgi:muramidase (phage lysozyme)